MAEKPVKVEITGDSSGYKKALHEAEAASGKFAKSTTGHGKEIAAAGAIAAGAVGAFAASAIDAASDYNETVSKSKVLFGEASETVITFAEDAAESFGLSQQAALDAEATFATFGKGAGLAGADLATFAQDLTGLAADMASFSNTSPEQAIEAIGAALRGEAEPIRAYGVLLDDATLKQAALKLGIYDGVGALTQQEKVLAAQAAIFEQTADAQGDFERTSEGLAGQQKILAAQFQNTKIALGTHLIPVAVKAVTIFNDLAFGSDAAAEAFKKFEEIDASAPADIANQFAQLAVATGDARSGLNKAKEGLTGYFQELAPWSKGARTAAEDAREAFEDLAKRSPESAQKVVDSLRIVAKAAENGSDAAKDYADQYEITTALLDEFQKSLPPTADALAETERETRKLKGASDDLASAMGIVDGEVGDTIEVIDDLTRSLADADAAYNSLTGKLDEEDAWAAAQEAIFAFNTNTEKTEQDVRDATRALADYTNEMSFIPAEKKTEIIALLNQGEIERVEAILANLARNRTVSLDIIAKGGAGFGGLSGTRAHGGPVSPGGAYLVGEKGPEVLQMGSTGGNVIPNNALGGGSGPISVTIQMPVGSNGDDVVRAIKKFEARNGPGWRA